MQIAGSVGIQKKRTEAAGVLHDEFTVVFIAKRLQHDLS
jgi:hypothetical protein